MAEKSESQNKTLTEVSEHYVMAKNDLDARIKDWDVKDELFRCHIKKAGWPYRAMVFDPRVRTAILDKTSRIIASKPRGQAYPREGGDVMAAHIVNELLSYQWDRGRNNGVMLEKWAMMDQNARKYGASFAVCKWWYEPKISRDTETKEPTKVVAFDGPEFQPINPRDALPDPNSKTIEGAKWFQVRSYPTIAELQQVNDASRTKPIYRNIERLKEAVSDLGKGSEGSGSEYVNKDRTISGLPDQSGRDPVFKTVEIVTEYRKDRWITFSPRHGIILRDIPNPYDHFELPIVLLRYYPTGNDIYGLSEMEPIERLQKAINALVNQYLDAINMELYPPLKIRAAGVRNYQSLEFGPGSKWIVSDPNDVTRLETSTASVAYFTNTYSFLVASMQEALGESSLGVSNLQPFQPRKTATEVESLQLEKNARDAYNMIFLTQALERQFRLWFLMNKQFVKEPKIIRIIGTDAMKQFRETELSTTGMTELGEEFPLYPVETREGVIPKLRLEEEGRFGFLAVEPEDLAGDYDFIIDAETIAIPRKQDRLEAKRLAIELLVNNPLVQQRLAEEGSRPKAKDLLIGLLKEAGFKDAAQFFEAVPPTPPAGEEGGEMMPEMAPVA